MYSAPDLGHQLRRRLWLSGDELAIHHSYPSSLFDVAIDGSKTPHPALTHRWVTKPPDWEHLDGQ